MARALIAFEGVVDCRTLDRRALRLNGVAAGTGGRMQRTQVFFDGVPLLEALAPALRAPAALHEVRVLELSATIPAVEPPGDEPAFSAKQCFFRIESREGCFELSAAGAQLHRQPASAFYAALPRERVPHTVRLGWRLLLTVLRVPGAARLLTHFRG